MVRAPPEKDHQFSLCRCSHTVNSSSRLESVDVAGSCTRTGFRNVNNDVTNTGIWNSRRLTDSRGWDWL